MKKILVFVSIAMLAGSVLADNIIRPHTSGDDLGTSTYKFGQVYAEGVTLGGTSGEAVTAVSSDNLVTNYLTATNGNVQLGVNSNKVVIVASSGNTKIAGTLDVTGASTLTGALAANGGGNVAGGAFNVISTDSKITNNVSTNGNLCFGLGTNKFLVLGANGNTTIAGTLGVTGAATLSGGIAGNPVVNGGSFTVASTDGIYSNVVATNGNFCFGLATNKFRVLAANGNTAIAGTLDVTGAATLSATSGNGANFFALTSTDSLVTNRFGTNGLTLWDPLPTTVQAAGIVWSSNGFLRVGPGF